MYSLTLRITLFIITLLAENLQESLMDNKVIAGGSQSFLYPEKMDGLIDNDGIIPLDLLRWIQRADRIRKQIQKK